MRLARRSPSVFALVTSLILVASVAHAGTLVPDPVKTGARDQFGGTGNADYFAWTQDVGGTNRLSVWVDPVVGSSFKVNGAGTGFSGAVDQTGSKLAWQHIRHNTSDVKLYDMATQTNVPLPSGINTSGWEWGAGVFGNMFTFSRTTNSAFKLYLVTDLSTGAKIKYATINRPKVDIYGPPRLYGNWIVWSTISAHGWKAYRYDIGNALTQKIPNPLGKFYYAPSVDVAGNVYFIRSGNGCGASLRLMKWPTAGGNPTILYSFDNQTDVVYTSVFDDGLGGAVTVYVDFLDCTAASFNSDIYSFSIP
ncbi:MAG TPA: hypothetical protein VGR41_03680 [Actinomycetota bacterium]|jgi:hypothetical protein|nr:hypothetical protein [Actinomycetota bacterium]